MSSLRIKDIREVLLKQTCRLSYLNGISSDPNFKIVAKSACKAQIYECKVFVNKVSHSEFENLQMSGQIRDSVPIVT